MPKQTANGISWTDRTWNPIRGCSRVSAGCVNCYAEDMAHRFSKPGLAYEGLTDHHGRWNGAIRVSEEHMLDPLKWKWPQRVFVNSMSDLFHENVADETIDRIFAVMALCPQHTFQVLTKRPERMLRYCENSERHFIVTAMALAICDGHVPGKPDFRLLHPGKWSLPNVWLGVSVENQATADERIQLLLQTPAAVRWISGEPLLGPINFRWAKWDSWAAAHPHFTDSPINDQNKRVTVDHLDGLRMLDWVVIGGESGTAARPFDIAWAAMLIDQCKEAGVACFMKQLGSMPMMAEPSWREQSTSGRTRLLKASNARRIPEGFVPLYSIGKMESFESLPYELRIRQYPEARQ